MLSIWKCNICKRSFLLYDKPSNCPYCNVLSKNIDKANKYYYEDFTIEPFEKKIISELIQKKIKTQKYLEEILHIIKDQIIKNLILSFIEIEKNQILLFKSFKDNIKSNIEYEIDEKKINKIYDYDEDNISEIFHIKKEYLLFYKDNIKLLESKELTEVFNSFIESEEEQIKLIEEFII
jgi:hypothetical protein